MDQVLFQAAVQVRLGSHRLPRKAFLPLGSREIWQQFYCEGKPLNFLGGDLTVEPKVLDWVLWNLRRSQCVQRFLLLCPECDAAELRPYAERYGFELFSGPEHDVLQRFSLALKAYPAKYCFRATADNPLASGLLLDFMIARLPPSADYYWIRGLPYGFAFELFRGEALYQIEEARSLSLLDREDCEHVTRYIYQHPEQFCLHFEELSELLGPDYGGLDKMRLTLDTKQDLQFLQKFFSYSASCFTGDLLSILRCIKEYYKVLLALKDSYGLCKAEVRLK